MMEAIWAQDQQNIIGYKGKLPWHIPRDLRYFKEKTMNKTMIMGRVTFEGMGKRLLPGRKTIILTRDKDYTFPGAIVLHSVTDLHHYQHEHPEETLTVIGGAEIFQLLLPECQTVYRTLVAGSHPGDTKVASLPADFQLKKATFVPQNEEQKESLIFEVWQR